MTHHDVTVRSLAREGQDARVSGDANHITITTAGRLVVNDDSVGG